MSEEFVKEVKTILASGKGDASRLRDILDAIKRNDPVYMSDYKYVQNLISTQESGEKEPCISDEMKSSDPVELLRMRLAEGKITIDEFRELKRTLKEF